MMSGDNGESSVLEGHIARSRAGFTWQSTDSYLECVRLVGQERERLRVRALEYARAFRWPKVVAAYRAEIARLQRGT